MPEAPIATLRQILSNPQFSLQQKATMLAARSPEWATWANEVGAADAVADLRAKIAEAGGSAAPAAAPTEAGTWDSLVSGLNRGASSVNQTMANTARMFGGHNPVSRYFQQESQIAGELANRIPNPNSAVAGPANFIMNLPRAIVPALAMGATGGAAAALGAPAMLAAAAPVGAAAFSGAVDQLHDNPLEGAGIGALLSGLPFLRQLTKGMKLRGASKLLPAGIRKDIEKLFFPKGRPGATTSQSSATPPSMDDFIPAPAPTIPPSYTPGMDDFIPSAPVAPAMTPSASSSEAYELLKQLRLKGIIDSYLSASKQVY
jgi:hypothetical protein